MRKQKSFNKNIYADQVNLIFKNQGGENHNKINQRINWKNRKK